MVTALLPDGFLIMGHCLGAKIFTLFLMEWTKSFLFHKVERQIGALTL
jgi:hypothetical protein